MKDVIILTRMYVGSYLQNNIGHEIINLFKDDNGDNYIYINHDGMINRSYDNRVQAVLLVRYVELGVMEVLAKAENLDQVLFVDKDIDGVANKQIDYIEDNNITYGGVPLHKIYPSPLLEKISITFKANKLRKAKQPFYIVEDKDKLYSYNNCFFLPEKHFSRQSLKMYYSKNKFEDTYLVFEDIINNDELWNLKIQLNLWN